MIAPGSGWPARRVLLAVMFVAILLLGSTASTGLLIALGAAGLLRWSVRSAAGRARTGVEPTVGAQITLGIDARGAAVRLGECDLAAHGLILGASGAGKSTTLLRILTEQIRRGAPVVAIDLKGSPQFGFELAAAAAARGREFRLWTPDGPDHWNPLTHGNATECKDKLIATERFTEPHYQRAAERYVQSVLQLLELAHPDRPPSLAEVVTLMEPQRIAPLLRSLSGDRAQHLRDYLANLGPDQLSAIRGLGTRLAIISEAHTGRYLAPAPANEIDLRRALRGEQVVLFSLNSSSYGKLSAQIGTLAVQDLVTAVGHRLEHPGGGRATIGIDEFSALGADNVISLLARGREAGVSVLLATQELADLDRAAPGLRDQVLGNTAVKLAHRQEVPASARTIAQIAGTERVWEPTFTIPSGMLGLHEHTRGSQRQVERFIIDPNEIRSLPTGHAVLITNASGDGPKKIKVKSPARTQPQARTPARAPARRERSASER